MRWMVRVLGLGVVAVVAAQLGLGCGGVQVDVGAAPVTASRPNCASVCQQMASCPGKGPVCLQGCQSAQSLASQAGCEGSLQAELDCLGGAQSNVCAAAQSACQTQTTALGACLANHCTHQRVGSPNQSLCLQAVSAF